MNNLVFHNNYHRSNHHTVSIINYPESSKDPIASLQFPFLGTFYNNYYDNNGNYIGKSNSYEWWSAYTLTNSNSSIWDKFYTTYTTVNSNSAFWDKYIGVYSTLNSLSSNWQSTYLTLCANIGYWNAALDPYVESYNKVQEDTKQKTFRNLSIYPSDPMNIVLDLSVGQVTTYIAEQNSKFIGFSGGKKGGIYHLILISNTLYNPTFQVQFDPNYFRFTNDENTYNITGVYLRKFQFLCDRQFLHGKSNIYSITPTPTPVAVLNLVTLIDRITITDIAGNIIFPIGNKGMVNFGDDQIISFGNQEMYPF